MNGTWTITYDGGGGAVEQSAATWGLNASPIIRTRDRSPTEFSFRMANAAAEGAIPFPFKAKVIIRQNRVFSGGAWSGGGYVFTGYQSSQPAEMNGQSQAVTLVFKDAIWLMQHTAFQQEWTMAGTPDAPALVSRAVLFMDINSWVPNTYQSVQWQIQQIIAYAVACGISIAAGTIDYSGWYFNYYHCRAISCWDAILKCLEAIPDAKVWIDGSATPPQLHVRTRANLAAMNPPVGTGPGPVTLPYQGTDATGRCHFSTRGFRPRYDLIPPQVVLQYQINNTVNGKAAPTWVNDVYPAGSNGQTPFAMVCPIDLTGASVVREIGTLDCEPLRVTAAQTGYAPGSAADHAAKRAWWANKRGGEQDRLADYRVRFGAQTIGEATAVDDNGNAIDLGNYPNRIVKGTYHSWMRIGGTAINCVRAHIKVAVRYAEWDVVGSTPTEADVNGNLVRKASTHELHCHITLTNAPARTTAFSGDSITALAETPVSNLAQNIYNSRAVLDYDGTHEIVDPGTANGNPATPPLQQVIGHWNVLNFSGGAAAWATANMTIAATEVDLFTNHVRIEVGPPKHLQAQDWNSMLQFFRYRRLYMDSSVRATGLGAAGGSVEMALNTPDGNTVPGLAVDEQSSQVTYVTSGDPTSGVAGQINSDAALVAQILNAANVTPYTGFAASDLKVMQPREIKVCDDNGNPYFIIVHCTGGYTKS